MLAIVAMMIIFKPTEDSATLVEVNELLDEPLTEVGPIEGEVTQRLDSEEYGTALGRKMRER